MNRRDLIAKLPFLGVLPFFQVVRQEKHSLFGVVPTDEDVERIYHRLLEDLASYSTRADGGKIISYPIEILVTTMQEQQVTNKKDRINKSFYFTGIFLECNYTLNNHPCYVYINERKLFDPIILFNRLLERFQPLV